LSRIGRAQCIGGRGNLPLAEETLRHILADVSNSPDRDIEARVEHEIAVVLQHAGQPAEALPHVWRAFERYEEEDSRLRALGDVGLMLLTIGDVPGAERALSEVVRRGGAHDAIANAMIELMHCASFRRDQIGFGRWRRRCKEAEADMPPNIVADYHLKAGIGEARFGQFQRADLSMTRALKVAEDAGLHEFVFKIERIKSGLRACEEVRATTPHAAAEPLMQSEAVRGVSASLAQLVTESV
jgi:hypothetical protein